MEFAIFGLAMCQAAGVRYLLGVVFDTIFPDLSCVKDVMPLRGFEVNWAAIFSLFFIRFVFLINIFGVLGPSLSLPSK